MKYYSVHINAIIFRRKEFHVLTYAEEGFAPLNQHTKDSGVTKAQLEKLKAGIRAKMEHPFRVTKCEFVHRKTRYWGIGQEHQPTNGDVCAVQLVDCAQANDSGASLVSAHADWVTAQKQAPNDRKYGELARNSLPVLPYEHSRINSRFGGGCADRP